MRLARFFRRARRTHEFNDEIASHLAHEVDEHMARGMNRTEAEQAARRKFGNRTQLREAERERDSLVWLETAWKDLRYGARQLRSSPGFAVTALLSLALGIGANAAIFQLLDAVRMKSLPVERPQELVELKFKGGHGGFGSHTSWASELTFPLFQEIRRHQQAFTDVFAWGTESMAVGRDVDEPPANGVWVTGELFPTLGVTPYRGQLFSKTGDTPGCAPTAVLSHSYWQRRFGGADSAIGSQLTIFGRSFTVIGVTPPEFFGLEVGKNFDLAVPTCMQQGANAPVNRRELFWIVGMGRLKPGWTTERAAMHLETASPAWFAAADPVGYGVEALAQWRAFRLTAEPGSNGISRLRDDYEQVLWLLLGVTGLVLLMACANLANLLLARAGARSHEVAVRRALGATRGRVVRQLLAESLLLACLGAAAGAGLALLLSRALLNFLETSRESFELQLTLDWRVLAFTAFVATATCVLFGLLPAMRASAGRAAGIMKSASRTVTAGRDRFALQRTLVVSQVGLSLVLLLGALLFVQSFRNLNRQDTGLTIDGLIFAGIRLDAMRPDRERVRPLQQEVLERLRALPGITSVATSSHIPLDGMSWTLRTTIPGHESAGLESPQFTWVSPGYFRTAEVALLAGRDISDEDRSDGRYVLVVNEQFARTAFGDENPLGKTVVSLDEPGFPGARYEIVGVVGDTKYADLRAGMPPIAYAPETQNPQFGPFFRAVVRTTLPDEQATAAIQAALRDTHPGIRVGFDVIRTMVDDRLVRERMLAALAAGFGILATALAVVGLYGVVSYMVEQRQNEMGIRLALGSTPGQIVWLVLQQVTVLLVLGVAIGTAAGIAAGRTAESLLFGLQASDPATLLLAATMLVIVAFAACLLPARRAAGMDPMRALRRD